MCINWHSTALIPEFQHLFPCLFPPYNSGCMESTDRTVLVFGTFDVIHPGHRWFLQKSARHGDYLVAAVARDGFVREWKGQATITGEEARMSALLKSGLVDSAVLSDPDIRTYGVIEKVRPDVICLGHDQKALKDDLDSWLNNHDVPRPEIVVLPPWRRRIYSSSRRNRTLRGAVAEENTASSWILYGIMIVAMGTFGFSWVSGKRLSTIAPPATLAFIRFSLTALCFIPLMLYRRPPRLEKRILRQGLIWSVAAAAAVSIYNILFFRGLGAGLAGQGGLIVTTLNPLFTLLIVSASGAARPRYTAMVGITMGIAGGLLLLEPWNYQQGALLDSGNLAFLAAALAWSLLTLAGRKAQGFLGFRRFNLGLYLFATAFMLPFSLLETGGSIPEGMNRAFWGDMLFISAAVGAFGTGAYFMASAKLGAARGSAFTYLVPVSALIFTSVFLGEAPAPVMLIGGGLAIAAVMLINRR